MQPVDTRARRYDCTTIVFHWATALLVAFQWIFAQVIDFFPRGPLRVTRDPCISLPARCSAF